MKAQICEIEKPRESSFNAIISLRHFSLLNFQGFLNANLAQRIRILVSCLLSLPFFILLILYLMLSSILWLLAIFISPLIDCLFEKQMDKQKRSDYEKWGMQPITKFDEKLLTSEKYDLFVVSSILMGMQGKAGDFAKEFNIYHSGIAIISKDGSEEFVYDLCVEGSLTNAVIPVFDFGMSLCPPALKHHVRFENACCISFYQKLDRNYWTKIDEVGECTRSDIIEYVNWMQTYGKSHSYNLVGVVVEDKEKHIKTYKVKPDTCINFVDLSLTQLGNSVDLRKLGNVSAADIYFVVSEESDFQWLSTQNSGLERFFKIVQDDAKLAFAKAPTQNLAKSTMLNLAVEFSSRFPIYYWYADIQGSQKFYELVHPRLKLENHAWTLLVEAKKEL